jgi:hypothetical protein
MRFEASRKKIGNPFELAFVTPRAIGTSGCSTISLVTSEHSVSDATRRGSCYFFALGLPLLFGRASGVRSGFDQ